MQFRHVWLPARGTGLGSGDAKLAPEERRKRLYPASLASVVQDERSAITQIGEKRRCVR
jgi:hypothetical protein